MLSVFITVDIVAAVVVNVLGTRDAGVTRYGAPTALWGELLSCNVLAILREKQVNNHCV